MNDSIDWNRRDDGLVVLTFDAPGRPANVMDAAFRHSLAAAVESLERHRDTIRGVILTSAKPTFFAGGDLTELRGLTGADRDELSAALARVTDLLRRLETLGRPVVAALNGAALGGGLEIALAAHHRIIVDDPHAVVGFPEVELGLMPGGGGIVRSVRLLGLTAALTRMLLRGQRLRPAQAEELGIVDDVVTRPADLLPAAERWIAEHPDAVARWDQPGYHMPGGTPDSLGHALPAFPARLRQQLRGAPGPAPAAILAAAVETAQVDLDRAFAIERRWFVHLATGPQPTNMIQAYFDLQTVRRTGGTRDDDAPAEHSVRRVAVLGAGMMGSAIAYVCARAGIDVVLVDVSQDLADRGADHSRRLVTARVANARMTQVEADLLMSRIRPTNRLADTVGADLVIEAVVEDLAVKSQILAAVEPHLADDAVIGSNTSALPISTLAERVTHPENVIGLHFFSPAERMPLLEIVTGARTSPRTLDRALGLARQIGKTPIVVRDSRGFFTSRVIGTYLYEGIAMLTEGIPAPSIEQAAAQTGYPVPALQLADELSLSLMARVRATARAGGDGTGQAQPADEAIDQLLHAGRSGRARGAGFYDYDPAGARTTFWPGLRDLFPPCHDPAALSLSDLGERMLFVEALESVRCLEEGVVGTVAEANVGSLLGIGFPAWTGGVLQYVNGYPGGPAGFVARARRLADSHGPRFTPPASLIDRARHGKPYVDDHRDSPYR
ncbi:3-hydroxyacyl-CoA dehydrogenase NAD-binding domain-containing protein [Plantactinospora sp. WMMB334]|uniref:3-hydroxyacyl-CoA dehydrogenase NAD-binding domain-containing protein n=1 Tax=Plantactinospora sp. WMMB334 TaxID=3404119 RepID=UPI003B92243A